MMGGHTRLLDLPAELLLQIAGYIRSFSDLACLGRTCTRLEGICELATRQAFIKLEKLAKSPDALSAIPAAQLILLKSIADENLCTPECAETLDCFSAYLHGRPAMMTCNVATNEYLRRCRAIAHTDFSGNEKMIRYYYSMLYIKMLKAFDNIECEENYLSPDRLKMVFTMGGAWLGILWTSKGGRNTFRFPQESIVLFNILSCLATGGKADVQYTVLQGYLVTDRVVAYGYISKKSRPSGPMVRGVKPLYITITLTGHPEWLRLIKDGMTWNVMMNQEKHLTNGTIPEDIIQQSE